MYPFIEIWDSKISMTVLWIVFWIIVFLSISYYLCKRNHQDFLKLFYQVPLWIIVSYFLWSYVGFVLSNGTLIPSVDDFKAIFSFQIPSIHFVWLLLSALFCFSLFFSSIKRIENKKIWADILFLSLSSACIILWVFLVLWNDFIGKTTESFLAIQALDAESDLLKYNGVYPIGIFLSFGALFVHIIINSIRIFSKRNGLWLIWFILMLLVLNICFLFQNCPRYWVFSLWNVSFDIKQYISLFVMVILFCVYVKWSRNKF